jgi:hypothetical protein
MLRARVEAGESGPVIMLAGEADATAARQLDALISEQLAAGAWQCWIRSHPSPECGVLGVDQLVTIRGKAGTLQRPETTADMAAEREPEPSRRRKAHDEHG